MHYIWEIKRERRAEQMQKEAEEEERLRDIRICTHAHISI